MTTKIDGTNGIVFPDATTQSTAGVSSSYSGVAKAWVNFNGTGSTSSNQSIRASFNVSSVFKNGTGDYTINFASSLADANYSISGFCCYITGNAAPAAILTYGGDYAPTTSSVRIKSANSTNASVFDSPFVNVSVYR